MKYHLCSDCRESQKPVKVIENGGWSHSCDVCRREKFSVECLPLSSSADKKEDFINAIKEEKSFYSKSVSKALINESLTKPNMKKTIEISLETAREFYAGVREGMLGENMKKLLLENFTKEELEGNKGYTWEESFVPGFYIYQDDNNRFMPSLKIKKACNQSPMEHFKIQYRTKEQAESALAFAQLSHVVSKYNEGKSFDGEMVYLIVFSIREGKMCVFGINHLDSWSQFAFLKREDAETSLKVNYELWKQYWGVEVIKAKIAQ